MLHLLKLEWLKQKDYVLFRLLSAAYLLFLPASIFIGKKMDVGDGASFNPASQFFQFPTVWEWLGYFGNWMVYFIFGFMAVLMVTNEYSNKTLRQNIITGISRTEYFYSKLFFIVAVTLAATLYYTICALVIGLFHADDTLYLSTVFKNVDMVPRFWLMGMGYMSFGFLIGLLLKRTGLALFLYLAYSMAIEPMWRWLVHAQVVKNVSMSFYPLNALEDLTPNPAFEMMFNMGSSKGFRLLLTPLEASIASAVYIAIFLFWSYKRLKNSDL